MGCMASLATEECSHRSHTHTHIYTHTYTRTNTHTEPHAQAIPSLFCSFSHLLPHSKSSSSNYLISTWEKESCRTIRLTSNFDVSVTKKHSTCLFRRAKWPPRQDACGRLFVMCLQIFAAVPLAGVMTTFVGLLSGWSEHQCLGVVLGEATLLKDASWWVKCLGLMDGVMRK